MRLLFIVAILFITSQLVANPQINEIINDLLANPINKTDTNTSISKNNSTNDEAGIQSNIDFSEVLLKTGIQFYTSSLYQQSIDKFNELIKTYPQSPYKDNAHVWIGKALIRQYKYSSAINELKKIKSDSGEFASALFFIGQAQQYKGEYLNAIESYNRLSSQFQSHELADNALLQTGKICLKNKLGLQALEATIKVIKRYASRETIDEAYYLLGKIFEQDAILKDIEIARTIYKKFLQQAESGKKYFKRSPLKNSVKRDLAFLEQRYFN